jgi:hypothetical protein
MNKLILVLSLSLILTSSASATIYKWVDENGAVNFTDDYNQVPPDYRDKIEEVNAAEVTPPTLSQASSRKIPVSSQSEKSTAQPPPIGQTLIREGDFAIRLVEVLKAGQAQSEAEAESILASVGIAPKNGWIADYPVTPDVIGELQTAVTEAAGSGKLAVNKDEAAKGFQDLIAQQGLPVKAEIQNQDAGVEQPYAEEAPPQDYPQYYEPSVIDNYFSDQGPPVVTYYPPPPDYGYLYAWVPYPFWYSGFWFPGFYCLHDFHKGFFVHGHRRFVSNHFWDSTTRGVGRIDPGRRRMGNSMANMPRPTRGFGSRLADNGASSILRRSFERPGLNRPAARIPNNRGSGGLSNFRGGVGASKPPMGYRSPSTGYSSSRPVPSGRPTYGSSSSHRGSFSHPEVRPARPPSSPSRSGSIGSHGSGLGSRGFSGGGGRSRR